jgi:hypothetical protein
MTKTSTGRGDHYGPCAVCRTDYEGRSPEEARDNHDAFEDHAFQPTFEQAAPERGFVRFADGSKAEARRWPDGRVDVANYDHRDWATVDGALAATFRPAPPVGRWVVTHAFHVALVDGRFNPDQARFLAGQAAEVATTGELVGYVWLTEPDPGSAVTVEVAGHKYAAWTSEDDCTPDWDDPAVVAWAEYNSSDAIEEVRPA